MRNPKNLKNLRNLLKNLRIPTAGVILETNLRMRNLTILRILRTGVIFGTNLRMRNLRILKMKLLPPTLRPMRRSLRGLL